MINVWRGGCTESKLYPGGEDIEVKTDISCVVLHRHVFRIAAPSKVDRRPLPFTYSYLAEEMILYNILDLLKVFIQYRKL